MTQDKETIGTILVPHDGTEMSDKALKKAELLARASGSQIIVIHVIDDRFISSSDAVRFIKDKTSLENAKVKLIKSLREGAESMLKNKIDYFNDRNTPITSILTVGSPADQILQTAKEKNVGLIIIGSRRFEGNEKGKMLGSVARKVSELSSCSVLIVH